jgi:hypothetical protein
MNDGMFANATFFAPNRRHYREIDANISVWTFVLDVAWQKTESGRDVRLLGSRASVREPTDEGKTSTVTMKIFKKVSITLSAIDLDSERAPGDSPL